MSSTNINTTQLERSTLSSGQGVGVYLGPGEDAAISQSGSFPTKLLYLIVPIKH